MIIYKGEGMQIKKLTSKGFDIINLPEDIWSLLLKAYETVQQYEVAEDVPAFIEDSSGLPASSLMSLDFVPEIKEALIPKLGQILSSWIGEEYELAFTSFYGIRSYHQGAMLKTHIDRDDLEVSGIIIIDYLGKNWALDIQSHSGEWHKVYAEPGQMILYESKSCEHGRTEPFQGEYFRNCYIHFYINNNNNTTL